MPSNAGAVIVRLLSTAGILGMIVFPMLGHNSSAHLPVFATGGSSYETAETIDNIETSYAFYGELPVMTPGIPTGAKYYTFEGASGQEFAFEVGAEDPYFNPCVLLVGPDLPNPDNDTLNIIESSGLDLPEEHGAKGWYIVPHPDVEVLCKDEFEPFTQTVFYYRLRDSVILPTDGDYYVIMTGVVHSEYTDDYQISSGKYFLVTGYKEEFTLLDFVLMPWYWLKVQSFWSQHGKALFLLPTVAVFAGLLTAEVFIRRKDETFRERAWSKKSLYFGALAGPYLMMGCAANQLLLLTAHSDIHDWEGIVILVMALQIGGLVLGVASAGFTKNRFFRLKKADLFIASVIAGLALLVGAGLIVGPVFLLGGIAVAMTLDQKTRCEKPRQR
jgi:hypothetical protein